MKNLIERTLNYLSGKDLVTFEEWVKFHQAHGFEYEWCTNRFLSRTLEEVKRNNPEVLDGRFDLELEKLYAKEN